jgi:predicted RNA-binding Zn ribbon-like protein
MKSDAVQDDVLLDLLNTTPVVDGAAQDHLASDAGARRWLADHGMRATGADLEFLRQARDTLQHVVRGDAGAESLQAFLDGARYTPVASEAGVELRLETPEARRPAVVAVLEWGHVVTTRPGRLRPCANPECRLFLIDRSKPNKARWCSMAVCGNRMKARRHYARTKDATAAE